MAAMTTRIDKPAEPGCRDLSNRTVVIIFGLLALGGIITVGLLAGWISALVVSAGILGSLLALILFQMAYQRVIFPVIALLVLGAVRLSKTALALLGKRDKNDKSNARCTVAAPQRPFLA